MFKRFLRGAGIAVLFLSFTVLSYASTASWYSTKSCLLEGTNGYITASGARFNENALTCALPHRNFGKSYKVTNLSNGKSVIVKHTDLGPSKKLVKKGRVIDLSKGAFSRIADLKTGVINVKVEAL